MHSLSIQLIKPIHLFKLLRMVWQFHLPRGSTVGKSRENTLVQLSPTIKIHYPQAEQYPLSHKYMTTLYLLETVNLIFKRQQKTHGCKEQTFGLCGRRWEWDDLREEHAYYHMQNRWPVPVWCMKQGTQSWCTETTQRDGVGSGVQDGEDTCGPVTDSCWRMVCHHNIINYPPIKLN